MTLSNLTRENLARAAVEGLLGLLGSAMRMMREQGVAIERVTLVGGAARSMAVRRIAPAVWGLPVDVPASGDDVADGAARQAAWALSSADAPPTWVTRSCETFDAAFTPAVQERYEFAASMLRERLRS